MIKAHRLLLEGNIPAILIYYNDQWQEEKSANDIEYGNIAPIKKEPEIIPASVGNVTKVNFGKKKTTIKSITKNFPDDGPLIA